MTIMEFLLNHKSSHLRQRKRELFDEITPRAWYLLQMVAKNTFGDNRLKKYLNICN